MLVWAVEDAIGGLYRSPAEPNGDLILSEDLSLSAAGDLDDSACKGV